MQYITTNLKVLLDLYQPQASNGVFLCCACVCGCAAVVYHVPHLILIRAGEHKEFVCGNVDGLILSGCVLSCIVPPKKWLGPKQMTFIIHLRCCECQLLSFCFMRLKQ